jgi:hypothetical protein
MGKFTLIPFHADEGMSIRAAVRLAGKSDRTIRDWCAKHGIGRRVAGGTLVVSKVALPMLLDGDEDALRSYRDYGVRASHLPVARYYERADLGHLLQLPEFRI